MPNEKKEYARKYYQTHRKEIGEKNRKYRQAHREELREGNRKYYQAHREEMREWNRKYRQAHQEYHKEYNRKYCQTHRKEIRGYAKKYYYSHLEKMEEKDRKYRESHREEMRERSRKWCQANPEQLRGWRRKYDNKKRKVDPKFRLDCNIGSAIRGCLKGKKAGRRWQSLVGYTLEDLMGHLEKQFDDKMNWENYGQYWDLDHIKPISFFRYTLPEDPEFKKCWALENLQPLEHIANIRKSNHYQKLTL